VGCEHNNPPVIRAPLSARSFSVRTRYLESFAILVPDPPRFIRSAMKGSEASMRARIRLFSVSRDLSARVNSAWPRAGETGASLNRWRRATKDHRLPALSLSLSLSLLQHERTALSARDAFNYSAIISQPVQMARKWRAISHYAFARE